MSGARRRSLRRGLRPLRVALAIGCGSSFAVAHEHEARQAGEPGNPFYGLDTNNLFGFLDGADVGEAGDLLPEGRFAHKSSPGPSTKNFSFQPFCHST